MDLPGLSGACYFGWPMRHPPGAVRGAFAAATLLLLPAGCASTAPFTWVNDYKEPPAHTQPGYVIQPGDIIQIRVFNQPDMSGAAAPVRPAGVEWSEKVLVVVDSVVSHPSSIPIALAADGVVLCLTLGKTPLAAARETMKLVGPQRFIGCITVP